MITFMLFQVCPFLTWKKEKHAVTDELQKWQDKHNQQTKILKSERVRFGIEIGKLRRQTEMANTKYLLQEKKVKKEEDKYAVQLQENKKIRKEAAVIEASLQESVKENSKLKLDLDKEVSENAQLQDTLVLTNQQVESKTKEFEALQYNMQEMKFQLDESRANMEQSQLLNEESNKLARTLKQKELQICADQDELVP